MRAARRAPGSPRPARRAGPRASRGGSPARRPRTPAAPRARRGGSRGRPSRRPGRCRSPPTRDRHARTSLRRARGAAVAHPRRAASGGSRRTGGGSGTSAASASSGTRNRLARSARSSSASASSRPVSSRHSSTVNRSAIEVLTRNERRSVVDPAEDLVGEVVEHEPLAAAERLDQRAGIGPVAQRDRRQLEARDPALGSLDEALDERARARSTPSAGEIAGRLLVGVAQVVGPQLDEPPVGPQAGERQRRVLAGQQDQVGEGRPALDQEPDQAVDRRRRR